MVTNLTSHTPVSAIGRQREKSVCPTIVGEPAGTARAGGRSSFPTL